MRIRSEAITNQSIFWTGPEAVPLLASFPSLSHLPLTSVLCAAPPNFVQSPSAFELNLTLPEDIMQYAVKYPTLQASNSCPVHVAPPELK